MIKFRVEELMGTLVLVPQPGEDVKSSGLAIGQIIGIDPTTLSSVPCRPELTLEAILRAGPRKID